MRMNSALVRLALLGTLSTLVYAMTIDHLPLYLGIPAIFTTAYLAGGALLWVRVLARVTRREVGRE